VNAWLDNEFAPGHSASGASGAQVLFMPFDAGGLGDALSGLMFAFVLSLLRGAALRVFWPAAETLVRYGGLQISPYAVPGSYQELPAIIRDAFGKGKNSLPLHVKSNLPNCSRPCMITGQSAAVLNMVGASVKARRTALRELAAQRTGLGATGSYKWLLVTSNRGALRALQESGADLVGLLPAVARPGRDKLARFIACSLRWLMLPVSTPSLPIGRMDACVQIRTSRFREVEDEELSGSNATSSTFDEFKAFFRCANVHAASVSRSFPSPLATVLADAKRATPLPLFLTTDSASLVVSAERELGPLLSVGAANPSHSRPGHLNGQGWSLTHELQRRGESNRTVSRPSASKETDYSALQRKTQELNSSLADWWHLSERCDALVISVSGFALSAAAVARIRGAVVSVVGDVRMLQDPEMTWCKHRWSSMELMSRRAGM
jgi:hypothetical protein